jgi:hypothetical protein
VSTAATEGKGPLARLGHRCKDAIKMGLKEIWYGLDSGGSGWAPVTDL